MHEPRPIDTLPENTDVFVYHAQRGWFRGKRDGSCVTMIPGSYVSTLRNFTHWLPLPDAPQ